MDQAKIDRLQQDFITRAATGRALHVGAGRKPIEGAVNMDLDPERARWVDLLADGQALPFADQVFDSIVSSHAVEHFPDPVRALCECVRVLRVGGFMVHIIPDARFTPHRPLSARYPFAGHHHEWTPVDFAAIIAQVPGIITVLSEFQGTRWSFCFMALRTQV